MAETVTREDSAGVATLTMLQPGLSPASRRELLAHARDVAADESVRAMLLTGTGRAFCVGHDLHESRARREAEAEPPEDPDEPPAVLVDEYNPLILALSRLPVPLVVGLNGACAGVGLSSDSAVASPLVHCVGGARATDLLLLPSLFLAETAARWGLVHRVVPPGWRRGRRLSTGRSRRSWRRRRRIRWRTDRRCRRSPGGPRGGRGVPGEAARPVHRPVSVHASAEGPTATGVSPRGRRRPGRRRCRCAATRRRARRGPASRRP